MNTENISKPAPYPSAEGLEVVDCSEVIIANTDIQNSERKGQWVEPERPAPIQVYPTERDYPQLEPGVD